MRYSTPKRRIGTPQNALWHAVRAT